MENPCINCKDKEWMCRCEKRREWERYLEMTLPTFKEIFASSNQDYCDQCNNNPKHGGSGICY